MFFQDDASEDTGAAPATDMPAEEKEEGMEPAGEEQA
jgi:hypothetical protein